MQHSSPQFCVVGQPASVGRRGAFTLVELLIVVTIIGILATIVVPQFSNASHTARENTLKEDLRYLRTQILVFKAQHRDVPPGYPNCNPAGEAAFDAFLQQMTTYTNEFGDSSLSQTATHKFGPYLTRMPANPINGLTNISIVTGTMPAPDGTTGWIYNPVTLEIIANLTGSDTQGVAYASY